MQPVHHKTGVGIMTPLQKLSWLTSLMELMREMGLFSCKKRKCREDLGRSFTQPAIYSQERKDKFTKKRERDL